MARVLVTGSSDGLGLLTAQLLLDEGHEVTFHARHAARAAETREREPRASTVVVGDLSSISDVREVAAQANELGRYHAVIHNAAVGDRDRRRFKTIDGLARVFAVNVLAPYLLTSLITPPERLVYLSSRMHQGGDPRLTDPQWSLRPWNGSRAYSDSKLYDIVLAFAVARRWPSVLSNAVDPGWVPTKMGGPQAPDDLTLGSVTQVWLATSDDPAAAVTGGYFYHQQLRPAHPAADQRGVQDALLSYCANLTGTPLPEAPGT